MIEGALVSLMRLVLCNLLKNSHSDLFKNELKKYLLFRFFVIK